MPIFNTVQSAEGLPLFREPAADFVAGRLLTTPDGQPYALEGREALSLWVRKALDLESARFSFPAHTASYGNEFTALLGSGRDVAENRMREMTRDCLMANPYITGVDGFAFVHEGSGLHASFTVSTIYGDFYAESEASIV